MQPPNNSAGDGSGGAAAIVDAEAATRKWAVQWNARARSMLADLERMMPETGFREVLRATIEDILVSLRCPEPVGFWYYLTVWIVAKMYDNIESKTAKGHARRLFFLACEVLDSTAVASSPAMQDLHADALEIRDATLELIR